MGRCRCPTGTMASDVAADPGLSTGDPTDAYLGWVEAVARACATAAPSSGSFTLLDDLVPLLDDPLRAGRDHGVTSQALFHALEDLDALGVVRFRDGSWVQPTQFTRRIRHEGASVRDLWRSLTVGYLDPEQQSFLTALVTATITRPEVVDLGMVQSADVFDALGWTEDGHDTMGLLVGLSGLGYVQYLPETGPSMLVRPTYAAVVRITQHVAGDWQRRTAVLLEEGETTTVDFKRVLRLDGERDKGEFVRDVLGLATTKASGRDRFLVIGFDDDTRRLVADADPALTRERLEQIINAYTEPRPELDWVTFPYEEGAAGAVVVRRDPAKVPYRVSRPIWKLRPGQVFVRHGSHTEAPTETELAALIAEGQRAQELAGE